MDYYFTDLIWIINKILFVVIAAGCLSLFVFIGASERKKLKRSRSLNEIIAKIGELTRKDKKRSIDGYSRIINESDLSELLEIGKNKDNLFPEESKKDFSNILNDSKKITEVAQQSLWSKNKWKRVESILLLGYLAPDKAINAFERLLSDPDEDISYFTILSLGHIKNMEAAELLIRSIRAERISGQKIASILETFPEEIVELLASIIKEDDPVLVFWAVKIISRFSPSKHIDDIKKLTEHDEANVRAAACECLGILGLKSGFGSVSKCLKDTAWFVRLHAIRAAERILKEGSLEHAAAFLNDESWFIQREARDIIVKHINKSIPYLKECLNTGSERVKKDCVEIVEKSGLLDLILYDVLTDNLHAKEDADSFLRLMIKSGSKYGLVSSLQEMRPERRSKVLSVIRGIDHDLGFKIEKELQDKHIKE